MSKFHYCQKALSGLNLTFEECVYAIAFEGLESEIFQKGKEAVFSGLPHREQMAERIGELFSDRPDYIYALKKTLNFPVLDGSEELLRRYWHESLEDAFCDAVDFLQKDFRRSRKPATRYALIKGACPWVRRKEAPSLSSSDGTDSDLSVSADSSEVVDLTAKPVSALSGSADDSLNIASSAANASDCFTQLQQIVNNVRFYQQKCEEGLVAIETLLAKMKAQDDAEREALLTARRLSLSTQETESPVEVTKESSRNVDIQISGSISQIHWPKCSLEVLRGLKIKVLKEAIDYFSNFDNFVNGKDITLWEWSVIRMTLYREGLLSSEGLTEVHLDTSLEEAACSDFGPSKSMRLRILNSLKCVYVGMSHNYECMDTVMDLVKLFSNGAEEGWEQVRRIRGFGKACVRYTIEMMRSWMIIIPPELCTPTMESGIAALDLSGDASASFETYQIETIGELMAACKETNRFYGLRYLDSRLYEIAVKCLKTYGFRL